MSDIRDLRGAAIYSALEAAEKRLPAAQLAAKAAQAQLDYALADGRDTTKYRADLEKALREKRAIHTAIQDIREWVARRNEDKIMAAASAIAESANAQRMNLLNRYRFEFSF